MHPSQTTIAALPYFQHDCVNDLYATVFQPDLLKHDYQFHVELSASRRKWLNALDKNPAKLQAFVSTEQRLGHYYENLWAFFLTEDPQFDLLAHNLVVRDEKKTIGEFDFIFRDRLSGKAIHLEVAIKFYLLFQAHALQNASDANVWFGPNSQDTLAKKYQHLINKQIKLNENPKAQAVLKTLGCSEIERKICLKGYLFSQLPEGTAAPEGFNPTNTIQPFLFIDKLAEKSSDNLYLLEKKHWISQCHSKLKAFDKNAIEQWLTKKHSPIMLAYCDKKDGVLLERQRLFICPSTWPHSLIKPYKSLNSSI